MINTADITAAHDPELDLVLEREVDVPPERWFAPVPWSVAECEIDLGRGGGFRTVWRSYDPDVSAETSAGPKRMVRDDATGSARPHMSAPYRLAVHMYS